VFNEVMKVLKEKDDLGVQKGEPKKCWFVLSVEEVVQPLRLQAREVAEFWDRPGNHNRLCDHVPRV